MNFLNRKMFANGGGANQYYYIDKQNNQQIPLDENKLFEILQTAPIPELEALIQNPSVSYSPQTQEIFRKIVGTRKARFSSVSPSMFEFGKQLPDYLSVGSGLQDVGGVLKDTAGEIVERGIQLGSGFMADAEKPKDIFTTDRYPFDSPNNIPAGPMAGPGFLPSNEGLLRRGYSNEQLASILNRAQSGEIQDFEEEVQDLFVGPIRQEPSVVSIDEQENIIEDTPAEREFNLNVRPPKPLSISDFIDEEIKDLTVNVNKTEEESQNEIQKKFIPTLPDIDPNLTQEQADKINEEEKKKEETSPDKKDDDAVTTLANKPGFFGSDNFLNFIRNVGGELVRTGQFGTGLASGAAKAAEERAARELLADQEERKYQREIELARAKAAATGAKPMATDKIIELNEKMITGINDFKGGVAATGFVDLAIETIEEAQESGEAVGGALGWINSFADKVGAFFGVQKEFNELSAQEKVNKLVEVVRQKNLQAILGESGRTISDRDRTIILEVFGDLSLTQDPSVTLSKLRESRRGLADNNEKRKRTIATTLPILGQQGIYGQQFFVNLLPIYGEIQGIDPQASQAASVLQRLLGQNVQTGVTEIGLAE